MGGSYEFAKCAAANLREKDDAYNPAIGGFFAGTMLGLRRMSPLKPHFPSMGLHINDTMG
jgi:hypothetical protein